MSSPQCRLCERPLRHSFVDLGDMPVANAFLDAAALERPEPRYPLHARVCDGCLLVQVEPAVPPEELFGDYAYFSSYSSSWVEHARRFAAASVERLGLGEASRVVEVASNDGYLLRHFARAGIPVLGVEPAANVAAVAEEAGVPTEVRFFGAEAARDLRARGFGADLLVGNNVLAHVPDLNDFVAGLALLLEPGGSLSLEFPHLLRLIDDVQFDTIYHEHFSYFSFRVAEAALRRHGLSVHDVERLPTHGGSLRLWAHRSDGPERPESGAVAGLREEERAFGLDRLATYTAFAPRVERVKRGLLDFLRTARDEGRAVVAYGAAAKGNTLLCAIGVGGDLIGYAVDRNPHKQGRFLPGSHLPIHAPERIFETRPDYVLILPWNLREEIAAEMDGIRAWGGRFVVPIPSVKVLS